MSPASRPANVLQVQEGGETSAIKEPSSRRYRSPRCSPGFSLPSTLLPPTRLHRRRLISEALMNGFVPQIVSSELLIQPPGATREWRRSLFEGGTSSGRPDRPADQKRADRLGINQHQRWEKHGGRHGGGPARCLL